ncbi:MAG: transporter [Gammaproteobacteria bacterium]
MFARWLMLIPALAPPTLASAQEDQAAGQYVSRQEYEKLLRELEVLKAQVEALAGQGAPAVKPAAPAVTTEVPKAPTAQPKPAPAQPAIAETGDREEEAREAQRQLDTFLRRQKLLFQAGELEIDFGAFYAKESLGGVGTRFANASVTARYGVADDIEFDLTVPLRYVEQFDRFQLERLSPVPVRGDDRRPSSVGLGDIDWAVRYAALREQGMLPDVVVALNAKSTTGDEDRNLGTGNWNVGTTVTLVKTIDPVVFFGSLGYTATLEDDGVNPGDEIPYSAGVGFSLNDRVSFSMTLSGLAVRRSSGSEALPEDPEDLSSGSADNNLLQIATTVQLMPGLFIEPFVAFGLTEESPDFIVGMSVPYQIPGRFPLPFVSEWLSGE